MNVGKGTRKKKRGEKTAGRTAEGGGVAIDNSASHRKIFPGGKPKNDRKEIKKEDLRKLDSKSEQNPIASARKPLHVR